MRKLVVLGSGTAGTMIVNKLRHRLDRRDWSITVVDRDDQHHYQPAYLFLPFGGYTREQVVRSRHTFLPDGVDFVIGEVDKVEPAESVVLLEDGRRIPYDELVIASGTTPRPDQTPGMLDQEWRRSIFDFYTLDGAEALADALTRFDSGRLVVHITEMPIKCPVAPLEFTFLAEAWLREKGIRDRVELVYVTPLDGAFTKPVAVRPPRRDARRAQGARRDGLHGRADRPRAEDARVVRRARGPLRPAGDRSRSTWAPTSSPGPGSATS